MAVREPNGNLHIFRIEHMIMGDTVCWDAFGQNSIYHFREISDIESNGAATAQRFFRKIVEGVCTKSLCEFEHRADNLLYRDGKYIKMRIVVIGLDLKLMGSSSVERIWKSY